MPISSARERVLAGVDCGFGTAATATPVVAPSAVWSNHAFIRRSADRDQALELGMTRDELFAALNGRTRLPYPDHVRIEPAVS